MRQPASDREPRNGPDHVLYESDLLTIGEFRAPVDHPQFTDSGPTRHHLVVFPRTSVVIRHEGRPPITTDPCTVTFYNQGQRYTREPVDPRGDHCAWFGVHPDLIRDVLGGHDPSVADRPGAPFGRIWGLSDARSYALQRAITRHLSGATAADRIAVQEAAMALLERVMAFTGDRLGAVVRPDVDGCRPAGLVERVRAHLRERFRENATLEDIAAAVDVSVFHLCRVFKRETGLTIHQYRQQLRLRQALEQVASADRGLTDIALHLGFSSHSHFSATFRRAFDTTPSRFRRHPSMRRIRELAGRLSISA